MKFSILLIALIFSLSFTSVRAEQKGTDIQKLLAKERGTFVLVFYDPNANLENNGKGDIEAEVQAKIFNKPDEFKDYKYFVVDATDEDSEDLVEQAHIDLEKLKHHPTVAASRNG